MNIKKIISLSIVLALIMSIVLSSTVIADTISEEKKALMIASGEFPPGEGFSEKDVKVKKEEAIKIAKALLENSELYEVGYVSLNPNWGTSGSIWNIEFYKSKAPYGNANASIDANTGEAVNFNIWEGYEGQTNFIANFTRDEARVKAEEYIKNVLKEDIKTFELQKDINYNYYTYRTGGVKERIVYNYNYVKKINNVVFPMYNINVGVDGTNGKVVSFYINRMNLRDIEFPPANGVIDADKILKSYKDSLKVELQYIVQYDYRPFGASKPKAVLAYTSNSSLYMVDAVTGKALNYDGTPMDTSLPETVKLLEKPVPIDPDARVPAAEPITEEQAREKAEGLKKEVEKLLGITFENNDNSYYGPYGKNVQEEVWNFNWFKSKEDGSMHFNVSISAASGHILNLGISNYDYSWEKNMKEGKQSEEIVEKINWEQGKEKALEMMKKFVPDQYGLYTDENYKAPELTDDMKKNMREYYYSFTRVVNGLRFKDNNISFSIDRATGEIRNFYFSWSDIDFPSTKQIISEKDAIEKYYEGTEAVLTYFVSSKYDDKNNVPVYGNKAQLVYNFRSWYNMYGGFLLDATTGKIVDWSGNEIRFPETYPDPKLDNHWAKRSTELLMAQGILSGSTIDYEAKVTRAEAVKMMSIAKGMYYYDPAYFIEPSFPDVNKDDPYYYYIENAVRQKILTETGGEFKGDTRLSKLEFVKLLTNMMGYSDLAKCKDIFVVSNVTNVSGDMKGYVAICSALGVLPLEDGKIFDGNAEVTYAEAAVALYKALSYIK